MVDKLNADHLAAQAGAFEPQRSYNWLLELTGAAVSSDDAEIIRLSLDSFAAPEEKNEPIEDHFLNESRFVPGKVSYETIPLVISDYVDVQTAAAMKRWSQKVQNPNTGKTGLAKDIKVEGRLLLFAPDGTLERVWILSGMYPEGRKWGELDMSSNEAVKIECTMRYDKAYAEFIGERPGAE